MTLYDLEKQATSGPLEVREEPGRMNKVCRTLRCATPFNRFGGKLNVIGVWEVHSSSGDVHTGVDMSEPDAKLLVHCRNNFMDALDTIKKCREILDSEYPDHDTRHPSWWLDWKIRELEEVEE